MRYSPFTVFDLSENQKIFTNMMSEVKNIPKSHLQEEVSFRGL